MSVAGLQYVRWLSILWLGCLSAGTGACETVQSRYVATALDANGKPAPEQSDRGIIVSGEELPELSSPLFGVVEVTFENHSQRWAHLRTTSIRFGSDAVDNVIYTPAGEDLWAWQQATLRRNGIRRYNTQLALATVAGVGMLTSAATAHGSGLHAAGDLVALASLGALFVTDASTAPAERFPGDYLLGNVISVPPGLFAKRWVVFHTPQPKRTGCLRRMQLGYEADDGRVEYVLLPFRELGTSSEWQAEICSSVARPAQRVGTNRLSGGNRSHD